MSLISVLQLNRWFGRDIKLVAISFDNRVSDTFVKGNKEILANYDGAEKVICLAPNIIAGFAGDYQTVEILKKLKDFLNKNNRYKMCTNFLADEIKKFIIQNIANVNETDIVLVIKNYIGARARVFKLTIPNNVFVELTTSEPYLIHSIGSSARVRNDVKCEFDCQDLREHILYNGNSNIDSPVTITKLLSYANLIASKDDDTVGDIFNAYYMNKKGWTNVGMAISHDNGDHFIASALTSNGIEVQVNGKHHMMFSSDNIDVNKELQKKGGR